MDSIAIEPSDDMSPESTLTCSATASDIDGGTPTLSYWWERNGVSLASTDTLSLSSLEMLRWGILLPVLQPRSTNMEAQTAPASPLGIHLQVLKAFALLLPVIQTFHSQAIDVQCIGDGIMDPNDDEVTLSYQWYINGSLQTGVSSNVLTAPFSVGDEIGCQVTNDGFDDGETLETSIAIPNSLPEIFSVEIDPSTDVEADMVLTCTMNDTDDKLLGNTNGDGDGNSAGLGSTITLNPNTNRPDDEITCIARVADNDGANTEFQSSIWIINIDPVVTNPASITSAPAPTSVES